MYSGDPNVESQMALAQASFQDARAEILMRLGFREKLVEIYMVGSVALVTALIAARQYGIPMEAYAISSVFSLVVAVQIRAHVDAVEKLANFIRWQLNPYWIENKNWAPTWDWYTRQGNVEEQKTFLRSASQAISIHLPSFSSLVIYAYVLSTGEWKGWTPPTIWFVSIALFVIAVETTRRTYKSRKNQPSPATPECWEDKLKEPS
ncbi:hypothetical protein [Ruegeria sp. HKCCD7255]|uniref:hypothetical protein n=1 Tax=Ruegeria sp. HKCCD7255 TaxID=2683004 RepID=UPI0014881B44|nr:hypothetical protein [Ruegeria sp. HKCCD7255]